VFQGVLPVSVQERYLAASAVFGQDHIQIYAPKQSYFRSVSLHTDPVMIGLVENVLDHGNIFFEIVRWDTEKDLAAAGL